MVTNSETAGQTGKDGQHGWWKDAHDVVGRGAVKNGPTLFRFTPQWVTEIAYEPFVSGNRWSRSCGLPENLGVRGGVTLARIGTWHKIRVGIGGRNREYRNGRSIGSGVRFIPGQS